MIGSELVSTDNLSKIIFRSFRRYAHIFQSGQRFDYSSLGLPVEKHFAFIIVVDRVVCQGYCVLVVL